MRPVRAVFAAIGLMLAMSACDHKLPPLTPQEQHTLSELTAHLTPRCAGRYLIDMPAEVREGGRAKIQGVQIDTKAMSEEAYRQEVEKREIELKGTESIDAYPFLYANENVRGQVAHYFVHRGTVHDDPATRYIEGYKWDRGNRFLLKIESSDFLHPDQTDDPIVKQMAVKNDLPADTATVLALLGKLRGRTPDEIPTEPGLCFAGGFMPGPTGDHEEVNARFSFAQMRDVRFVLFTSPNYLDDTTIAKHADSAEARMGLKAMDGTDIRKRAFDLSGMPSTEWLLEGLKPGNGRGVDFSMALNELSSKGVTPYLRMRLTTGGQYWENDHMVKLEKGSLSPSEAVGLWDAVSRTVRLRPGAM